MTEAEWLSCIDPRPMLEFLRGKVSDRKWCLVGCAWWRSQFGRLANERVQKIVEVTELVADGMASRKRLRKLFEAMKHIPADEVVGGHVYGFDAARCLAGIWTDLAIYRSDWATRMESRSSALCGFLQDISGPLPIRPVVVDSSWLMWNEGTVAKMAQAIYADLAFDRLAILADALEEADCRDADILGHCRQPGPHVRGCWVIDLLTDRE
jgi:hypothetical protein